MTPFAGAPASSTGPSSLRLRVIKGETENQLSVCPCKNLPKRIKFIWWLFLRNVYPQVQELEKRISELERQRNESAASLGDRELVSEEMDCLAVQPQDVSAYASELECIYTPGEGMAGAWVIGHQRHPELKGRAMRDTGVQAEFFPPPAAAAAHLQGHVLVQTDVCEKADRSTSPLPAPPPVKETDDGEANPLSCTN